MSREIREKDHEWVCKFHSNFDRLLASFEKLFSQRRPPVYGDELLTDKEVSHLLKVSRRTLQVSIRPRACFFPLFSFLPLWLHYNLNPLCVQY